MAKVWFITGTSKGFGRIWARAAPRREECARRIATSEEWEPLSVRAHGHSQLTIEEN